MRECDILPGEWAGANCACKHFENHTGIHVCADPECHNKWYDDGNEVW